MVQSLQLYEGSFIDKGLHISYVFHFSKVSMLLVIESLPPCPPPLQKDLFCGQALTIFCTEGCR